MKKLFSNSTLLLASLFLMTITACSEDVEGVDPRFVGTWVRDASVSGIKEEVYTLVLNDDATASYSWYRHPTSSSLKDVNHESRGTWRYDETENRIITDCVSSGSGAQTVIFDVINVTETTLVVKMEGADKSRTFTKKYPFHYGEHRKSTFPLRDKRIPLNSHLGFDGISPVTANIRRFLSIRACALREYTKL